MQIIFVSQRQSASSACPLSCIFVVQPSGYLFSHEAHLTSLTIQSASDIFMIAISQPAAHKIDTIFALL
jgi:hypothetical protein